MDEQGDCKLLKGKTVIITGANQGIGYETCKGIVKLGAKVIMACRDLNKALEAKNSILQVYPNSELVVKKLDLASLKSVSEFAEDFLNTEDHLDILINNAAVMCCPQSQTEDGIETHFGVNHVGHFLLTNLLLDLLKKGPSSRIVVVASAGYKRGTIKWNDLMNEKNYVPFNVYFDSKLANVLFAQELARRLQGTTITCNSLHPGMVNTNLARHIFSDDRPWYKKAFHAMIWPIILLIFKNPAKGSETSLFCATSSELNSVNGLYFNSCKSEELLDKAKNQEDGERLWKVTEELIATKMK